MSRNFILALTIASLFSAPLASQEKVAQDPTAQLTNRSYCAADLGDGWIAAGSTYGVLFYDLDRRSGTVLAPQRLEPASTRMLLADSVNDLAFADGLLVVANGPSGIKLVTNVSRGDKPHVVGTIDASGAAIGVAISGHYLAVAMGVMGVALYDISVHDAPLHLATYETEGYARQVRFTEPSSNELLILLIANGRGGIAELTVEPEAGGRLVRSSRTRQPGDVRQVLPVPGGIAVSRGKEGVCLLPHLSRKAPEHCLPNLDVVRGLALAGDRLLVGDGGAGLVVVPGIDGWEPGAPVMHTLSQGSINRLYVFDDTVVIAADYFGILVFPASTLESN